MERHVKLYMGEGTIRTHRVCTNPTIQPEGLGCPFPEATLMDLSMGDNMLEICSFSVLDSEASPS